MVASTAMSTHALVEHPDDLRRVPAGAAVVAAKPAVEVACLLAGVSFVRLAEGLDPAEIEERAEASLTGVERLCSLLDELAGYEAPRAPGRWHLYQLRVLHDGVFLWSVMLADWLDRLQPSRVVSFATETLLSRTLVRALAARGITHERLPSSIAAPQPWPPPRCEPGPVRRLVRQAFEPRRPSYLTLDRGWSMPALASELDARGSRVGRLRLPQPSPRPATGAGRALAAAADVRAVFSWGGVDYAPAVEPVLQSVVEDQFPRTAASYDAIRADLARIRPRALLLSVAAHAPERAACAAAASLGVPAIVSRHGELGMRHVTMTGLEDLDVVSHALCWGPWEAAWIARHVPRPVRVHVVGSPYGESVKDSPSREEARRNLGIAATERVVVYLPHAFQGDAAYFGRVMLPDLLYLRARLAVLRSLAAQDRFSVVVKEHPGTGAASPLREWCERELPGCVRFLDVATFRELVHVPDAVVLDYPSTTMVEALFGRARILVTEDPISVWEPGVREHLRAHGVIFAPVGTLGAELAACELRDEPYPPEARAPLLVTGPGSAASRLADAVLAETEE